ncbi:glycosyl hydrolase family 18 protein [Streptosporangium sp. NPDC051022]|uniref:chitinase C-terminal domain-containing protein n=1 Tax=Streptosporangium sp. NPDC051022 TaxID=3155752 RepID=UPI003442357A
MSRLRSWRAVAVAVIYATATAGMAAVGAPAAHAAASLTAKFTASDRGTWWQGGYEVKNSGDSAATTWTLEFDLNSGQSIGNWWNGTPTISGSHVTVKPGSGNANVPAGGTTGGNSFGFVGMGPTTPPANCKINGNPCEGGPPPDTPPTAPGKPVATPTTNSVALTWAASTDDKGVSGYDVYQGTAKVKSVTTTSATVDGLTPDTEYTFTVKARDTINQESPASPATTVRTLKDETPDTEAPTVPGTPTSTARTTTSVTLQWGASTDNRGVTSYEVYNGDSSASTVTGTPPGTTTTITGLTADTEYTFKVRAKDKAGNQSGFSGTVTVRTDKPDTEAPTVPGTPTSTGKTNNSVTLSWGASTDNKGVTAYEVYRGDSSATTVTGTPPGTTATITGLTEDTEYTFKVRAKDAAGNQSDFSGTVTVRTDKLPTDQSACRPDGLYQSPGVTGVPYCTVYDTNGREKMGADHPRRVVGYFTSWRTGKDGSPSYLAKDIPWDKITHINYAFAHIDGQGKVSVGSPGSNNPSIGMEWPGVAGAEMDPAYSYKGHFNQLNKFKKQHPNVKTMLSIGGWAETGGYIDDNGTRQASGGFYTMTSSQASINTFADSAVKFIKDYGFDGVDIDYEYATSAPNAGNPDDFSFSNPRRATLMAGYVNLMKTLRQKLDAAAAADGKYYLLTAATTASGWILRGSESYQVTPYLDFANMMTYDLHGAWNRFVGPLQALYDDGSDAEMKYWNVYGTYSGIGYMNGDWAFHHLRGAMQAGRINLGLGYYSRGWKNVVGGTDGLWGTSDLPDQNNCPEGTGGKIGSKVQCGDGAIGIDNLWHDLDKAGKEVPAGVNPVWHFKNLQEGKQGSYITQYGLTPDTDPTDRISGTYARKYSSSMVAPWLWNNDKKVYLSTEDDQSVQTKADYVASKGLGGIMIWELAGDYNYYPQRDNGKGEYFIGDTLTTKIYNTFKTAAPYGNLKAGGKTMPTDTLNVQADLYGYAVGDANYPISPKLKFTNNSTTTIPGGATIEFDYGTSAPATMSQTTGWTLSIVSTGHTGPNTGGLKGDFHRVRLTVPTWESIAPGQSKEVQLRYDLPIATPSNFVVTFGGKSYRMAFDYPR